MTRDDYKRLVDEALQKQFLTDADFPMHGLAEAMRYSLLAGGKRDRHGLFWFWNSAGFPAAM